MAPRSRQVMPADVEAALASSDRHADYDDRPAYQRNDYLGWIAQAKGSETRSRRIVQMLNELARGGVYMGMSHAPSRKNKS